MPAAGGFHPSLAVVLSCPESQRCQRGGAGLAAAGRSRGLRHPRVPSRRQPHGIWSGQQTCTPKPGREPREGFRAGRVSSRGPRAPWLAPRPRVPAVGGHTPRCPPRCRLHGAEGPAAGPWGRAGAGTKPKPTPGSLRCWCPGSGSPSSSLPPAPVQPPVTQRCLPGPLSCPALRGSHRPQSWGGGRLKTKPRPLCPPPRELSRCSPCRLEHGCPPGHARGRGKRPPGRFYLFFFPGKNRN